MDLSNSDGDLDDLAFMSSPKRPKATPISSMFSTQTISALETVQLQEIFGETDENKRKRVGVQEQLALLEGGLSRLELLEYNSPSDDDDDEGTASEDDEL